MLIENQQWIAKRFPETWRILKTVAQNREGFETVRVIESKCQSPTIAIEKEGTTFFIHSKYNPVQEAESLVMQYQEGMARYKHIFFYGVGLGYHIEAFLKKYPAMNYTIFEPNPVILYHFLSQKKLTDLPQKGLKNIFLDIDTVSTVRFISSFVNLLLEEVLFVTLPSYQRIFAEKYETFHSAFMKLLTQSKLNLIVNNVYEKKWAVNCICNFKEVLQTPNVIANLKNKFTGKPAIVVAAGPSTDDEIERLRQIKQEGLAYIFATGSGLVPLITNDIIPDATCIYDPNDNLYVFQKQLDKGITSVPLLFGSSVGPDIFSHYQGPKLHMLISQDTVSHYFLKYRNGEALDVIDDASTVTIIAIRLLAKLGFNPIILVGQNLAYRDQISRAGGIDYYEHETSATSLQNLFSVEAVDGSTVFTNIGFDNMRKDLEKVIGALNRNEIINTTSRGAKIDGTRFIPLSEVMATRLREPVVTEHWWQSAEPVEYDREYLLKQLEAMEGEYKRLEKSFKAMDTALKTMERLNPQRNGVQLNKTLVELDKEFIRMQHNLFFKVFLKPMKRVEFELITKQVNQIVNESNLGVKAQKVIKEVGMFVRGCQAETQVILPLYHRLQDVIREQEEVRVNH